MKISNLAQRRRRQSLRDKETRRRRLRVECLEDRRLLAADYGDAPDQGVGVGLLNYQTIIEDNGPSHALPDSGAPALFLGTTVDADVGTLQNIRANADDVDSSLPDDEDGVLSSLDLRATIGAAPIITVSATNTTSDQSILAGWIDYNQNGVFEPQERATATVNAGSMGERFLLTFPTIASASTGQTYARFRISSDAAFIADPTPIGAASNGEVEDYQFVISARSNGLVSSSVKLASGLNGVPAIPTNNLYHAPANLGDFDGDGIDDLVVTSRGLSGQNQPGSVYIHRMNADGTVRETTSFSISSPNFGSDVASIGDVNGDGVTDLVVGSNVADGGNGAVFVIFLNSDGSMQSNVKIGTNLNGGPPLTDDNIFGASVAGLGDLDGDGIPDVGVGAYLRGGTGAVFVLNLNADGTVREYKEIRNGLNGLPSGTLSTGDAFGYRVEGIGDLDGDGVGDMAVQSPGGDSGRGKVHLLLMNPDGTVKDLKNLSSGIDGVPVIDVGDSFGRGIAAVNDIDGNGVDDIIVGVRGDDTGGVDRGAAYLLFLNANGSVTEFRKIASDLNGGPPLADGDAFGDRIASVGDLDGDGISEIAVMAGDDDTGNPNQGALHVLFLGEANKKPTLDPISDLTIDEDVAEHTVNLTGITAGGNESQPLRITAVSDQPSVIPDPVIQYVNGEETGGLTISPIEGMWGSATITVTVEDGGLDGNLSTIVDNASFERSFTVTYGDTWVYWLEGATVKRSLPDGSQQEDFLSAANDGWEITNFDIDPISNRLFYAEMRQATNTIIGSIDLDGNNRNIINSTDAGWINYSLAVDGVNQAIYLHSHDIPPLSSVGPFFEGRIQKIAYTGELTLLPPNVVYVHDMEVDAANDKLYYTHDYSPEGLYQSDLNGNNVQGIFSDGGDGKNLARHPDPNKLFYAVFDGSSSSVFVVNTNDGSKSLAFNQDGFIEDLEYDQDNFLYWSRNQNGVGELFRSDINSFNPTKVIDGVDYIRDVSLVVQPRPASVWFDEIVNLQIAEDADATVVAVSGVVFGGGTAQSTRLTALSSNHAVILDPVVNYESTGTTGTLTLEPLPNQHGSSTITVTVESGGPDYDLATAGDNLSFSRTFDVIVNPINDDPTLDGLSNLTIDEDASAQTVNLTGITAGGGESQPLRVTAVSSVKELILDPTVTYTSADSTGTLHFKPLQDQSGVTTITVTIEDGGLDLNLETLNDNATHTRTFDVTVNPVNDAPTLADYAVRLDHSQTSPSFVYGMTAADFNNDGVDDFVGSYYFSPNAGLHITQGSLTYSGETTFYPLGNLSKEVQHADIDGDGDVDLIASNYASHSQGNGRLYVLNNDGNGSFSTTFVNVPGTSPAGIAHGDFDNDGDIDVAMAMHHSNTWRLLKNDGNGTFTVAESYGVATPEDLVTADVNGDGWIDVVGTNLNGDQIIVFLNDTNGGFNTGQQIAAGDYPSSIAVGDFNGDNHIDLVVSNQVPDTLSLFLNNGAGVFSPADVFTLGDSGSVIQVAINDWDKDGVDDIIALSSGSSGSALFFFSPFNGNEIEHSVPDGGVNVVAGDFDGDSQIEYAVSTWIEARDPSLLSFYELGDIKSAIEIFEDGSVITKPLGGIGPGPNETQHIRVTATSSDKTLIPNPEVTYSSPDNNGLLEFSPVADANGTATITVTVEDAGLDNDLSTTEDNSTFSRSFDVTVNPVNDAPVLDSLPDIAIDEDGVVHGNGTDLTLFSGDIDSDESKLEFRIVNLTEVDPQFGLSIGMDPQSDSFTLRADNTIHVHPTANFFGSTQVIIEVRDPEGDVSSQQTFNLDINAVNDPPVLDPAIDLSLSELVEDSSAPVGQVGSLVSTLIDENGPLSNYSDIDGIAPGMAVVGRNIAVEKIWFSTDDGQNWQEVGSVSDSEALVLFADASTRLYAQTAADFSGDLTDALTIKAWDQTGGYSNGQAGVDSTTNAFSTTTDTVSLSVEASPSSAVDDFYAPLFDSGEAFVITKGDLLANDTFGNGESIDTVTITADTTSAAGGTISVEGDTFTYTRPSSWFSGIDTFAYTLDDGGSTSNATVTILSGLVGETLTITLEPGRDHEVTLQYSDDKLVMVDHVTQTTLLNIPRELVPVNVEVVGAPANANIVTFKELSGQTPGETNTSWSYQGGSANDDVAVLGTGSQWAWLSSDPQVENDVTVELKLLTTLIDTYTMIAVEKVSVGQVDRIEFSDPYLEVGTQTFDLGSSKPVNLPTDVTISEGILRSSTPVGPHVGESIVGSGVVEAVFAGGVGSLVRAAGDLIIGSTSDSDGFRTDGRIEVGANTVTLLDSNQAELGSLTTLGTSQPGKLHSDYGFILEFGDNLEGFGTIETLQGDSGGPLVNNGNIAGNSSEQPITINAKVKGVGTFDNVVMNGEFTPGFSPALWKSGTVAYTDLNRFVVELGGRIAGSEFDRVEHYLAKLGGTLDVQLIDGFKPALGDLLEVITSEQPFEGDFKEILLPLRENGVRIREILDQHGISLETVYDVADTLEVLKSQVADYEIAGHDGSGLRIQGDRFRALVTSLHQFVAEHPWHTEELELQAGQLVQIATDGINRLIIEGSNWKNFVKPSDVNNDQNVSALDALTVINELGRRSHSDDLTSELKDAAILVTGEGHFYDQNGDGKCTALDALRVINELARISNGGSGEGEFVTADYLTVNAADVWTQDLRSQGAEAVQDDSAEENEFEESHLLYSDAKVDSSGVKERPEDLVYATAGQESTEAVDTLLSELEDWLK